MVDHYNVFFDASANTNANANANANAKVTGCWSFTPFCVYPRLSYPILRLPPLTFL